MKKLLYLLVFGLLVACGGAETADESTDAQSDTSNETATDEIVQSTTPLPDPCTLNPSEVASTLGWTSSTEGTPAVSRQDQLRGCDYVGKGTEGRLSVVYERYSERAGEDGYLSGYYDMLLQSNSGITYENFEGGPGDQCLYGHGRQGPNYVYELKWREGERTDKRLTLKGSEERNADEVRAQLKSLSESL